MEVTRKEMIMDTVFILSSRGYMVSDLDLAGLTAYDLIARKGGERYVIKVLYNIDTFRSEVAREMISISKAIDAGAVVIGRRSSVGELEQGVMYFRHDVPILSLESFEDYVDGNKPVIFSGPGGYYMPIDGERMRRLRESLGYSIGHVSSRAGISRRSVSLYEAGSAATVEVAEKIESLLNDGIGREIDILQITRNSKSESSTGDMADSFLREVFNLIQKAGYDIFPTRKTPYDAVACEDHGDVFTLGAIRMIRDEMARIRAIVKASIALESEFLLVSDSEKSITNLPERIFTIRELETSCKNGDLRPLLEKNRQS